MPSLHWIDYVIMLVYFAFVLGIGFVLTRFMRTSTDFFLSGRAIPAWVCGLAFISANLGAQEVIGMAASGAKYGIATSHFYWLGAIPAMVFVGIFMMPFYYGSRARSVPEYLRLRFDEKTRGLNAITFAFMTVMSSGISMYAMARLVKELHIFDALFRELGIPTDWIFDVSLILSALIVLGYISLGGLTSAIYNEVLQFFLIVAGLFPLVWLGLQNVGGWDGLRAKLTGEGHANFLHAWAGMDHPSNNPMGVEWFGLAMGLGFVLSFGYWCTDFLVVQRAMAAESMSAARRTPLIAALPKMLFPALVILPGIIAIALTQSAASAPPADAAGSQTSNQAIIPLVKDAKTGRPKVNTEVLKSLTPREREVIELRFGLRGGQPHTREELARTYGIPRERIRQIEARVVEYDYNMAMPNMLLHYFPSGMLGLGLTALLASFMSGMAGNVTAFNTVWTFDIYAAYLRPGARDRHYVWMGRFATVFGIAISVAAAYVVAHFNNIMDLLQQVFSIVNAPLFATFLLGMFWTRTTGHGAFVGLLAGTLAAVVHHGLTLPADATAGIKGGWLGDMHHYPSEMAQSFWQAIYAWSICFVVTIAVSIFTAPKPDKELEGLVYSLTPKPSEGHLAWYLRPAALGVVVLLLTLVLNIVFM
jgi:SSS family solute:Na+ symporter